MGCIKKVSHIGTHILKSPNILLKLLDLCLNTSRIALILSHLLAQPHTAACTLLTAAHHPPRPPIPPLTLPQNIPRRLNCILVVLAVDWLHREFFEFATILLIFTGPIFRLISLSALPTNCITLFH